MSENKCPTGCGGNLVDARVSEGAIECAQCFFRCHKGHLPRIAAALELANATAEFFNSPPMAPKCRLQAAGERVLEVFNAQV